MNRLDARRALVRLSIGLLTLAGAALTIGCVIHFGWRSLVVSFDVLGWQGLLLFCAYTLALFVLLGFCWFILVPDLAFSELPAFVFGRLMREAAADTLPFSQVGGFVLGVRGASLLGAQAALASAASVVDIAAEMAGQLLFTMLGLIFVLRDAPIAMPRPLHALPVAGLAAVLGIGVLLVAVPMSRRAVARGLVRAGRFLPTFVKSRLAGQWQVLAVLLRRPARVAVSLILHFAAWLAASGGVWLVLWLMRSPIRLDQVIALESLVYVARNLAFFVPGAIGVLEGSYVLFGPAFGLPAEAALSLALIKRGRDLAIATPVLIVWQMLEHRLALTVRPKTPRWG